MFFTIRRHRRTRAIPEGEAGQTIVLVCIGLGLFLLAFIGLAVDFGNFWFHRQMAQSAADAACQAGAMDMLLDAEGSSTGTEHFKPGTAFSCSGGTGSADSVGCKNTDSHCPNAVPCKYASLNGYGGGGLTANTPSNDVAVSFPAGVPGVTTPPSALSANPFMKVQITDRVQTYFSRLITGSATQDVVATAKCGVVVANAPIPIVVLHPTLSQSLSTQGTPTIFIMGGPQKSIQVNSNSTSAVNIGGNAHINLHLGGPNGTGSDLGVFGIESAPGGFVPGTTGHWYSPASPISDPFAQVSAPSVPGTAGSKSSVGHNTNGCPDSGGCDEYTPGNYPSGITVKKATAIFDPGIYYLSGDLSLDSNSMVRPSTAAPTDANNPGGTMFYFSGTHAVSVNANSGKTTVDPYLVSALACPGNWAPVIKDSTGTVITQMTGNVLVGPCSASGSYGDGSNPATAQHHGMLFFGDRSASGVSVSFGGGGGLLTSGNIYFHHCNATGTGTGCLSVASNGYNDTFTLQGGSGSGTFILGDIIVDSLTMGGNSTINMVLDPQAKYNILKVTLLQ